MKLKVQAKKSKYLKMLKKKIGKIENPNKLTQTINTDSFSPNVSNKNC